MNILYVSEKPFLLNNLKEILKLNHDKWRLFYAGNYEEAYKVIKSFPVNIIICNNSDSEIIEKINTSLSDSSDIIAIHNGLVREKFEKHFPDSLILGFNRKDEFHPERN